MKPEVLSGAVPYLQNPDAILSFIEGQKLSPMAALVSWDSHFRHAEEHQLALPERRKSHNLAATNHQ